MTPPRRRIYEIDQRMTDAVPQSRRAEFFADLDRIAAALDG